MTQMTTAIDGQGLRLANVAEARALTDAVVLSQLNNPAGLGTVRASPFPQRPLGVDSAYAAFPGACLQRNGALRMVWRQGTDHATARDGVIRTSLSLDRGRSWSPSMVLLADAAAPDLRDPSISVSRDGTRLWLTYFKGSAANAAGGVFARYSLDNGATWTAEQRVDTLTSSAVSAPVTDLGGGLLILPYYGRATGDTFDSVWAAYSDTNGLTWNHLRVADGQAAGRHYQEPWLARSGNTLIITHRYGNATSIGYVRSTNGGQTWSAPVAAFAGGGRAAGVWLSTGALAVIYRRLTDGAAVARYSLDAGTTWYRETRVAAAAPGFAMNYAAPVEVAPGLAFCPIALESSAAVSRHYLAYLAHGTGTSPLGDQFLTDRQMAVLDNETTLFADTFNYPDGALPWPYLTTNVGNPLIADGVLVSATADNVPDYALVGNLGNNVIVDADLYHTVQTGHGVIVRWIDANNFLLFTVEGAVGLTNYRFYKRDAGTITTIATQVAATLAPSSYNRLTVHAHADVLQAEVNGDMVFRFVMAPADYTKYQTGTVHGVKVNAQTTAVHRCRRLVIRTG